MFLFELMVLELELLIVERNRFIVLRKSDDLHLEIITLKLTMLMQLEDMLVFLSPLFSLLLGILQLVPQVLLEIDDRRKTRGQTIYYGAFSLLKPSLMFFPCAIWLISIQLTASALLLGLPSVGKLGDDAIDVVLDVVA